MKYHPPGLKLPLLWSKMNKSDFILTPLFVCLTLLLISNATSDKNSMFPTISSIPKTRYDVFVCFRGSDIRRHFLSHVLEALSRKKIHTFFDDKLHPGDDISTIHRAIEASYISLVIFSPGFASSLWCLDELVKIFECREEYGQIILPVFYGIPPSDVRRQNGVYEDAFADHEKRYKTKVSSWRSVLGESANISGFESSKFSNDAKLVEEIVKRVLTKLKQQAQQVKSKALVGIEKPISQIESMLRLESEDVLVIGISGMPGIGKTTIAEEVFNRLHFKYDSSCLMANVREESERHGTSKLKERLLSNLLEEEGLKHIIHNGLPPFLEKRLLCMEVLIVLDDVNDSRQLEILVGKVDWLGPGSRIVITARDKQVLARKANHIYNVEALSDEESFRLFKLHAFKEQSDREMEEFYMLSRKMVDYAKGVPLALEGLAQLVYGKDKDTWKRLTKKVTIENIEPVLRVFKLIYNNLGSHEKKTFLDIACFFDGLNMKVEHIKLLLKDQYNSVDTTLERLKDKFLLTISQQKVVSMHDIIQKTADYIVRQEPTDEPGSRSRLLHPNDVYEVLKNNKGSDTIRSMVVNASAMKELQLSRQVFAKMSKLQFLDIYTRGSQDGGGLHLPEGIESFPNELRYLRWEYYPLESLPSKFSAENLVILNMPYSQLRKLWHEGKDLVNLNTLKLVSSTHLIELPDLSKATSPQVFGN